MARRDPTSPVYLSEAILTHHPSNPDTMTVNATVMTVSSRRFICLPCQCGARRSKPSTEHHIRPQTY